MYKATGKYHYEIRGDEEQDMFPYVVVDPDGVYYNAYSHRAVADNVADDLNTDAWYKHNRWDHRDDN